MGGSTMNGAADDIPSLVQLNVGGKRFSTSLDTLTQREPDSMLATMFSGRHNLCRDDEGYVFIDRDGEHFRHILNWLRDGEVRKLEDSVLAELLKEADYYQLLGLKGAIHAILKNEGKGKKCRDITRNDIIKLQQAGKHSSAPKRPLTAFVLFMGDFRKAFKEANPDSKDVNKMVAIAKEGGEKWKLLTDEEKKPYLDKAAELKAEFKKTLETEADDAEDGDI